jgi:N-acetylglucosamine-6-phosphate deacetylase
MGQAHTIVGRHYSTGLPVQLQHQDCRITSMEQVADAPADLWIAPTLVDLQVNGYGGVDYQQDLITVEQLISSITQLHASGCSEILLTLITRSWDDLMTRLKRVRQLREQSPILRSAIAGWHIEGPFLSPEPGFHGAHNPKWMVDPTEIQIRELRTITGSDRLMLTLAPEHPSAIKCIALAKSLGIKISLGHTNASTERIRAAIECGATGFTHLGNGIPQQLDRHDNIIWRVFDNPGLTAGVIPDKIHVSPTLFRIIHKQISRQDIYYTTDAMSAAGAPPGNYTIGDVNLTVGADQVVRQPGRSNFAGSALRPIDVITRAAEMLNCRWQEIWGNYSTVPRRLLSLNGGLAVGNSANFCIIQSGSDNQIRSGQSIVQGAVHDLKL